ncbi:MAG: M23 family metallopeptidase [Clostridia bacterium]|nr:M23 family metallopeptidase [Clostridia bacterium]
MFISIFFTPALSNENYAGYSNQENGIILKNPNGFVWPIPGYNKISSAFGRRVSPTSGASSEHSGIDIPAIEGSKLIAVADGEIIFCNFLGAGGYTITLSFENYKISYCHCSPNFIVKVGDRVEQGQVIRKCRS